MNFWQCMTSSDIHLAVKIQQARQEIKQLPLSSKVRSNAPLVKVEEVELCSVWRLSMRVNVKVLKRRRRCPMDTCDLIHKDAGGDDAAVLGEELLQLLLGHSFGQATDIQVCISNGG